MRLRDRSRSWEESGSSWNTTTDVLERRSSTSKIMLEDALTVLADPNLLMHNKYLL